MSSVSLDVSTQGSLGIYFFLPVCCAIGLPSCGGGEGLWMIFEQWTGQIIYI